MYCGCLLYLSHVPLPIPLLVEVGELNLYMLLELARLEKWLQKFQPSLIASAQRVANTAARNIAIKRPHPRAQHVSGQDDRNNSITRAFAMGFVTCGDCDKPRVIYLLRHRPEQNASACCG